MRANGTAGAPVNRSADAGVFRRLRPINLIATMQAIAITAAR